MGSGRRKQPIKTGKVIKIVLILAVIAVAAFFAVRMAKSRVTEKFGDTNEEEVQSAQVTKDSISTTISGSGTLENEESEDTSIPQSVDVTEIYVEAGDKVTKGDMLASVNTASVVETMSDIQTQIDAVDTELSEVEEDDSDETITSGVDGRVKKIYAAVDTALADTMYANQALMLISLDGYMSVDVDADTMAAGDSVTVTASDGTEYTGTVESIWGGKATILVTDNGTVYGDTVTITYGDSKTAEGTLAIHEEVAVTGYTGTVSAVNVSENSTVSDGTTLLTLDDVTNSANYQTLLEQREDLEEDLQNLIVIYKEGAVYAQSDGLVTSITEQSDSGSVTTTLTTSALSAVSTGTVTESSDSSDTIISICPTDTMSMVVSVDESQVLSLSVGQEATVTVDALEDESFDGTITEIDKVGSSSDGVTTYSASVEIERTDAMLEGMSASAEVKIEGKDDALLVPSDAVKKTSSTYYVYTSYDEETGEFGDMKEVTIGITNGTYTEITEGLEEGDTVYYSSDQDNAFGFGGFGNMDMGDMASGGGEMSFGGGDMPSGGGGDMPSGGGAMPGNGGN